MKTIYLAMTTILLTTQVFATVDIKKQDSKLASVLKLEQNQEYFEALLISAQSSAEILNQLQVDQVVASIESKLNEIRNEVVTSKSNQKASGSLFFGLFTGKGEKSWDAATIITANPEEVSGFTAKVATDFFTLQKKLTEFVQKNEVTIAYAKAFALKTVQLASKLSAEDRKNLLPLIKSTVQFSQKLRFLGAQSVMTCTETNYANRSKAESSDIGGWLLSFGLSSSETQSAYSSKNCVSSSSTREISDSDLASAKLYKLDALIAAYQKQLGLLEVVETKAEPFQTWGSPSYK